MRNFKKYRDDIIKKVESNLEEYLAMKSNMLPLDIFNGNARLNRISDNLIRLDLRGYDY